MVSDRSQHLLNGKPVHVAAHFACVADPFDAGNNPKGYVNWGTAENHLLWDWLAPKLQQRLPLTSNDTHYAEPYGSQEFRTTVARYLTTVVGRPVPPEALVIGAGVSALIEGLAYVLGETDDGVLIPAPFYPGFKASLKARGQITPVPVPQRSADGFALTPGLLEAAWQRAQAEGVRIRALLLTTPHNPLATTFSPETLRSIMAWAVSRDLHVIADEVYARSVYGDQPFTSTLALDGGPPERLHVLFGFGKDFGISGFRVGILHTVNPEVLAATRSLAAFAPVSTLAQKVLTGLLSDLDWVDALHAANRQRLSRSARIVVAGLAAATVRCVPPTAGLFLWADLRRFLPDMSVAGEMALFERLFHEHRLNLTPGSVFQAEEPGWFRICFAQSEAGLTEGLARLRAALAP